VYKYEKTRNSKNEVIKVEIPKYTQILLMLIPKKD